MVKMERAERSDLRQESTNEIEDPDIPIFQMTAIGINCAKITLFIIYNNKKRIVTDITICEIISELDKTEWNEILNGNDVNISYETFVNKLTAIYSKKCPIVQ